MPPNIANACTSVPLDVRYMDHVVGAYYRRRYYGQETTGVLDGLGAGLQVEC